MLNKKGLIKWREAEEAAGEEDLAAGVWAAGEEDLAARVWAAGVWAAGVWAAAEIGADRLQGSTGAFDRMEDKANRMLDEATAMSELNRQPIDEAQALEQKYQSMNANASVEDELASMKAQLE